MTMPLDERDPHYALGLEHARAGVARYEFQDAENQRRYDTGRARVAQGEAPLGHLITDQESLRRFQRLGQQMQRDIQSWYAPRRPQ
jgi:hypothetical protein